MFGAFGFGEPYLGQDKGLIAQIKHMISAGIRISARITAHSIDFAAAIAARVRLRRS